MYGELAGEDLFDEVDPGWSLKVKGLRSRRMLMAIVVKEFDPTSSKVFGCLARRAERLTAAIPTELVEGTEDTQLLVFPPAGRDYSSGFLMDVAGGIVQSTTFSGRVADIDEDCVGAVLTKIGPAGTRGDDFVAYLPLVRFGEVEQDRLRIGALFDWKVEEFLGPSGESSSKGQITLLADEPFTERELAQIDRDSEELLTFLTDAGERS
jgi:hypothetical protein